jgi:hypothetical protein
MPKKTRKEKILAEARRIVGHNATTHSININKIAPPIAENKNPYSYIPVKVPISNSKIVASDQTEFNIIRKDLVKTVFLTIGAVFLELIVYWQFKGK